MLGTKVTLTLYDVLNDHGRTYTFHAGCQLTTGKNKPADAVTLKQPVKALADMLNHKDEMCPQPFFSRYAKNMTFVTAKQLVKLVQAVAENLDKTLPDPLESNQPLSWLRGSLDQIKLQRVKHKDNWDVQECMLPNKRKTNNSQAVVLSNVHESC